MSNMDEFRIIATKEGKEEFWTRNTLTVCRFLARYLVEKQKYDKAIVINTFGGDLSNPLFVWPEQTK